MILLSVSSTSTVCRKRQPAMVNSSPANGRGFARGLEGALPQLMPCGNSQAHAVQLSPLYRRAGYGGHRQIKVN
jgi:hypothetical protein